MNCLIIAGHHVVSFLPCMCAHRHIIEHFLMHIPVAMLIVDRVWAKVATLLLFAGVVYGGHHWS